MNGSRMSGLELREVQEACWKLCLFGDYNKRKRIDINCTLCGECVACGRVTKLLNKFTVDLLEA